ncbi:MAG: DUF1573 domain-containing protein [Chloroflexi bacterium]|jgi:hypothetical protein|nr:DUF1573 domain-containing protein [Chloroflexota bacterium]
MSTKIAAVLLLVAMLVLLLPKKLRDPLVEKLGRPIGILAIIGALLVVIMPAIRASRSAASTQAPQAAAQVQAAIATNTPEVDPACRFEGRFPAIGKGTKGRLADISGLPNPGQAPLVIHRIEWSCQECMQADVFYGNTSWKANRSLEIPPGKQGLLYVWYYPERDPMRKTDHDYQVTIHSNAENCPKLVVDVRIRYE